MHVISYQHISEMLELFILMYKWHTAVHMHVTYFYHWFKKNGFHKYQSDFAMLETKTCFPSY